MCDEGVGVSKLLLKQCRFYLPNEQIGAVFTTEQFKSVEDITQVDLLITTNDELESRFPVLKVNPILEAEDILRITDFMKNKVLRKDGRTFKENLSTIIGTYISVNMQRQNYKKNSTFNQPRISHPSFFR